MANANNEHSSGSSSSISSLPNPSVGEERLMVKIFLPKKKNHLFFSPLHSIFRLPFEFDRLQTARIPKITPTNAYKFFPENRYYLTMAIKINQKNMFTTMYLQKIQHKMKYIIQQRHR